ncbi:Hypothetical protein PYTT_0604 [Akkermansia glycaniphila]|uniref:Uncharacterized protein n=2 Tax=Akkermansia glycaniphila TaxID=1679444 RepID=A0A1H6KN40_9BACT|nr:Hypothetical protein PYTT_0604 [Akkermansia glycaniphila]
MKKYTVSVKRNFHSEQNRHQIAIFELDTQLHQDKMPLTMMQAYTSMFVAGAALIAPALVNAQEAAPAQESGVATLEKLVVHLQKLEGTLKTITDAASAEKGTAELQTLKQEAEAAVPGGNINIPEEEAQANMQKIQECLQKLGAIGQSVDSEIARIKQADCYGNDALKAILEEPAAKEGDTAE